MDEKTFQIDVLNRLTAIETILKQQDYKAVNEDINKLKERVTNVENATTSNSEDIHKMEDNARWLWRTIGASLIPIAIGAIVAVVKLS